MGNTTLMSYSDSLVILIPSVQEAQQ